MVTKKTTWQAWTPDSDQFKAVDTPTIEGYTPDKTQVKATTVKPGDNNIVQTVTYNADQQKITVNYIDDTTKTTMSSKNLTGDSGAAANYTTKSTIDNYLKEHYQLVSDETNGQDLVFDNNDKVDQVYNQ